MYVLFPLSAWQTDGKRCKYTKKNERYHIRVELLLFFVRAGCQDCQRKVPDYFMVHSCVRLQYLHGDDCTGIGIGQGMVVIF